MKARRLYDGEIIEVKEWRGASGVFYATPSMSELYEESDLDFDLSEPEDEVTINGYVTKDAVDGEFNLFTDIPTLYYSDKYWIADKGILLLPKECKNMFSNLDCKTVQEVTITIKPKKK